MIGAGIVEIMNKSFYAKQDTKTPLFVGILVIIINIILSVLLGNTKLGYRGLALATSVTALLNATVLIFVANKKQTKIISRDLLIYIGKIVLATILMAEIVILVNSLLNKVLIGSMIKDITRMIIGAISGIITYFVMTIVLKANEIKTLLKK